MPSTPIAEAMCIPRTLLQASPTNPRKHFDATRLAEMRQSIERHGVLQPLVVRAIAGRDGSSGQPLYEIVSGERRWRASEGAQDALPCMVQQLTDLEVLEIQIIENVQRDDLHPLEEADGYEQLLLDPPWWSANHRPRLQGYSIDELALRIGKSRSHVYARLRLLGLTPTARHAFFEHAFGIASALQIARLNTMHQDELVQALLRDDAKGAAWSADTISHIVQQRYMLRLAGAPFNLHDAALVPDAGACSTCPKRSGANPELFDDITEADTCADRACFMRKCDAHEVAAITIAQERGHTVITGIEAARLLPTPDATIKGYLRLGRPSDMALSHKPLGEVLGSDARDVALIVRSYDTGTPSTLVEVMPTPIVRQVLQAKGLLREDTAPPTAKNETKKPKAATKPAPGATQVPAAAPAADIGETDPLLAAMLDFKVLPASMTAKGKAVKPPSSTQQARYTKSAIARARSAMIAYHVGMAVRDDDGAEGLPSMGLARVFAMLLTDVGTEHKIEHLAQLADVPAPPSVWALHSKWAWGLEEEQAARLVLVQLAADDVYPSRGDADVAAHVARLLEVDTTGVDRAATDLVTQRLRLELLAIAPKAPKAAPAKKASKASTKKAATPAGNRAPCKYRHAATGETWSGRGVQPKWLKVALANGKTLADFELAPQPAQKAGDSPAPAPAPAPVPSAKLSPEAAWPFPGSDANKITALQLDAARTHVIAAQRASISGVQRTLMVGYNLAARILEQLELQKIVGPVEKDGARKVLVKHVDDAAQIPAA